MCRQHPAAVVVDTCTTVDSDHHGQLPAALPPLAQLTDRRIITRPHDTIPRLSLTTGRPATAAGVTPTPPT